MDFSYTVDYLFAGLALLVLLYLLVPPEGYPEMPSIADLSRHIENMKRANSILSKAADDAPRHAAIMDSMEQRMTLNDENMNKIAEFDKLMHEMEALGNGGPALEATFSASPTGSPAPGTVSHSTVGIGKHGT